MTKSFSNPKFEILNPKQYLSSPVSNYKRFGTLLFVSCDLFRAPSLGFRTLSSVLGSKGDER